MKLLNSRLSFKLMLPFLCLIFVGQVGFGQKLTAHTAAKEVLVNHEFDVVFEFSANISSRSFVPPNFGKLKVVVGPELGSSTSMINGKIFSKTSFTYTVVGTSGGKYQIGAASVVSNGKKYKSNPLIVNVVSGSGQLKKGLKDVFLEVMVVDTPAYPGSQVVLNYILHTSINLADVSLQSEDDYGSFIEQDLTPDGDGVYEVLNGKQYVKRIIRSVALYPSEAGLVKVKPMQLVVEVPSKKKARTTSLIEQFFSTTRYEKLLVQSDAIEIRTNRFPYPIAKNFSGATGRLEMEVTQSDTKISTDDAVSIKVKLVGTSNPTEIKAPLLHLSDELMAFDPKVVQDTVREQDGRLAFSKTFEYLLQPNKAGKYTIQATTSYFDNATMKFKDLKGPLLELKVTPGSAIVDTDLFDGSSVSFMPFVWGILGLLVVLFGLFVWKRSHRNILPNVNEESDVTQEAPNKSIANHQELPKAEKPQPVESSTTSFRVATSATGKQYLQEVLNEAEHYLGAKLKIPHGQFKKEQVFHRLEEKGNPPQRIHALKNWWLKVETSLYANMPLIESDDQVLDEIKGIMSRLKY